VFDTFLSPGAFHEDAPHGFRSGREEVATALPGLVLGRGRTRAGHQAQVGLVHEGRGLKRMPRLLMGQLLRPLGAVMSLDSVVLVVKKFREVFEAKLMR
jgi:hypothetical protein